MGFGEVIASDFLLEDQDATQAFIVDSPKSFFGFFQRLVEVSHPWAGNGSACGQWRSKIQNPIENKALQGGSRFDVG